MEKPRGRSLILVLMPLLLILGGAGLALLGLWQGSLVLMAIGVVVAVVGVLWSVIVLDLANPFEWF